MTLVSVALLTLPIQVPGSACAGLQSDSPPSCQAIVEDFYTGRSQGEDVGTMLAAISRLEEVRKNADCLRCVPERGIAPEELEAEACRDLCEDKRGVLAFHRELGDLYKKAAENGLDDSSKLNGISVRLYDEYLTEFLGSPCKLAPLTESEWPRYVVVALGNALVGAGRGQDVVEKYEALAERTLDYAEGAKTGLILFDASALRLWRKALDQSSSAHRSAFCELMDSRDLLVGTGTRNEYREECASP